MSNFYIQRWLAHISTHCRCRHKPAYSVMHGVNSSSESDRKSDSRLSVLDLEITFPDSLSQNKLTR